MENLEKNNDTVINRNQILSDADSLNIYSNENHKNEFENSTENIDIEKISTIEEKNITPVEKTSYSNSDNELEKIDTEAASTTNCLALTIKEEHKLVAVKNICLHSLKVTWKVIASTIALHILKIFF